MRVETANENVSRYLGFASLVGVVSGISLMACGFFVPSLQELAAPGLLFLIPGLIYGLR